jgi:CheY-like chemotaxis protein
MTARSKVLVVDDDADLREALTTILALHGLDVLEASTGAEALERLHQDEIALVVLDLMMPDINGADVLATMRRDPALASTRVLILSGDWRVAETATRLGADGYLAKPIEMKALLGEVRRFVGGPT